MSKLTKNFKIKSKYDPSQDDLILTFPESIVDEQFAEESDINNIMKKYSERGVMPISREGGLYADVSEGFDFVSAQEKILRVREEFESLPAHIREELKTPEQFYQAFTTEKGLTRLKGLGLIEDFEELPDPAAKRGQRGAPAVAPAEQKAPKTLKEPKETPPASDKE